VTSLTNIPASLLLDPDTVDDPQPFYRRLVSDAPVWRVGNSDIFAVSSYSMVEEATLRTTDFSSNLAYLLFREDDGSPGRQKYRDNASSVLAVADPPAHSAHKKIVSPYFSPNRIASLGEKVANLAAGIINEGLRTGEMEVMSAFAHVIPIQIISEIIGFEGSDPDILFRMALASSDILAGTISREELLNRMQESSEAGKWLAQQLLSSLEEPREGILGGLAFAIGNNEIDIATGIGMLHTLLSAGGESTASLIGNAVRIMADDKEIQQVLREDISLVPNFIDEVLRLESPFRQHMRWVPKTTALGGVEIPAGSTLLLLWGAANRDPAKFEHPDELNLNRPRRHVAFGHGIHTCLGNTLARLEARVALETILCLTSEVTISVGKPIVQVPSLLTRRYEQFWVRLSRSPVN
jgi:cytochrome P450